MAAEERKQSLTGGERLQDVWETNPLGIISLPTVARYCTSSTRLMSCVTAKGPLGSLAGAPDLFVSST